MEYDYINDDGHKIKKKNVMLPDGSTSEVETNVTKIFERPGKRTTSNLDILVIEASMDPEECDNPAIPADVQVAREARTAIERRRRERDAE